MLFLTWQNLHRFILNLGIYINHIKFYYIYLAEIYRSNQINDITPLNALSNLTKLTSLNIGLGYLINPTQSLLLYVFGLNL